jgi:hypothetical protein
MGLILSRNSSLYLVYKYCRPGGHVWYFIIQLHMDSIGLHFKNCDRAFRKTQFTFFFFFGCCFSLLFEIPGHERRTVAVGDFDTLFQLYRWEYSWVGDGPQQVRRSRAVVLQNIAQLLRNKPSARILPCRQSSRYSLEELKKITKNGIKWERQRKLWRWLI